MGEAGIMYQLIVNYALSGNIDQSVDDVEWLGELAFPPSNFGSSPQASKRLESIQNWHSLNTHGSGNEQQQQPTLIAMIIAFNPYKPQLPPTTTPTQSTLTLLFPLLLFLTRGLLIPDLIPVCRTSIAALFNLIIAPFVPMETIPHLSYTTSPQFLPTQLTTSFDLTPYNQMQYEWVIDGDLKTVVEQQQGQGQQQQHPIIATFNNSIKPNIATETDVFMVECTIKHLISSFYGGRGQ